MSKTRMLIVNNEVIAYTDDKKMLKDFIHQYKITNYHIEKIDKIPEELEVDIQYKELYQSHDIAVIINDYLMHKVELFISGIRDSLEGADEWFGTFLEYMKLTGYEQDSIFHFYYHVKNLIEDITPQDDNELLGFHYGDYFMLRDIVVEYLQGKIKIEGVI